MSQKIKIAAIQMCSGIKPSDNLLIIENLVKQAKKDGATYVLTPEMSISYATNKQDMAQYFKPYENNEYIIHCAKIAKENKVFLHIGSMAIANNNKKAKYLNRSILFSPNGEIIEYYDKIHLFDASPPEDKPYKESKNYLNGKRAVVAKIKNFKLGFSICYDLRFPELYNELYQKGAQLLSIPAAFTVPTGKAHWQILLQARAIETGSYVIAAAQGGKHENGRETFGHSMIIDPWGEILALKNDTKEGFIIAQIDMENLQKIRKIMPNKKNNTFFC